MNGYAVARLIEEIAETSSRTEKEKLVLELVKSDLGRFVLKWAYDPMITYGIRPAATESSGKFKLEFTERLARPLLEKLANRELTGNAAEAEVAECMAAFDPDGARLLFLILSKDLKCGIAESTINGVWPGLIPVFAVMRAHPYEAKKIKSWPRKAEYKLDGQRNTLLVRDGQGGFFTRSGKVVPALDFLVTPVIQAAKTILAGERVTPELRDTLTDAEGKLSFMLDGEAMMGLFADRGALSRKGSDAVGAELHLYDILSYADFDEPGAVGPVLADRRSVLREFVYLAQQALAGTQHAETIQMVPQFFVNSDEEVQAFFDKARATTLANYLARGNAEREEALLKTTIDEATGEPKVLEGAMIKDPDARYEKKKSNAWLKVKAEETEDLRVVGFFNGQEHTKLEDTTGGIIIDRAGVRVRVSGMSDAMRAEILNAWRFDAAFLGAEPKVGFKPGHIEDLKAIMEFRDSAKLQLLGRLAEVEFHEVTPDGSLRHPRFVRFRDDKDGEIEDKEKVAA